MSNEDRKLGMHTAITRREFFGGMAGVAASSLVPGQLLAGSAARADYYPPLRSGLRGSHPGSYEIAHQLAWQGVSSWGAIEDLDEEYDLVVVGAGISGLAAAYFYQQEHRNARILLVDNHDDFGGHAKRNEFELNGHTLLGYGGSQTLEEPGSYNRVTKRLLKDLGVDVTRFEDYYDQDFYRRHGLAAATYFDKETFGVDRLVPHSVTDYTYFLPMDNGSEALDTAIMKMPISDNAKRELYYLMTTEKDHLDGIPFYQREEYLWRTSYYDFLKRHIGITEPEVFQILQGLNADMAGSLEVSEALSLMSYVGFPGLTASGMGDYNEGSEPYIHHFPDGNASIARMLVRRMIPRVAPGDTMEDVVLARFDYHQLDMPDSPVRVRLNSTAVRVEHVGDVATSEDVAVTYVQAGKACRVRAKACVMAGYNAMLPAICPEIPDQQGEALRRLVKSPIIYTTVLLNNWRAFERLNVGSFVSPGAYYVSTSLDFPVSMGGYKFSSGPDQPIIVHMEAFLRGTDTSLSESEQRIAGRRELFATPFETIERNTRRQLAGALGEGGFDAAKDIEAITVNRWGHGYSLGFNSLTDWELYESEYPYNVGRKGFGRIAIANSDAAGSATLPAAISQAHRAIAELT
ncbi:MAG: NAD(P)-binding protein [Pseudomonadota bacterium]